MDVTMITQLVGSLGFPIVCCGYMMLKMNKTIEENTKATNSLVNLVTALITGNKPNVTNLDGVSMTKGGGEGE